VADLVHRQDSVYLGVLVMLDRLVLARGVESRVLEVDAPPARVQVRARAAGG
jgi:hypothetical protein